MVLFSVAMLQLWYLIGPATFSGIGVIVIMIFLNGILGRWQQGLQGIVLANKSNRIKILNEIINGIKVNFSNILQSTREPDL